ncbi:MAG: sugar ABC transporter ATP-binding protein [Planctomyces sp.]|nr:sugar ABC transporter ATP-binding protein [Planctomyces sp.]
MEAGSHSNRPLIEIRGICKSYTGVVALSDVSLSLMPGEVHALCGENGAGKSTLIKLLAGTVRPDSGSISCLNESLSHEVLLSGSVKAAEDAGIAVMHQESTAFPDLNAVDNIYVGRELTVGYGLLLNRSEMRRRTHELLHRLGEHFSIDRPLRELSLAQRQMVALARALSLKCRLLIMDEPTASLSMRETQRLMLLVRQLRSDGICVLYVSHRLEEVFELSDRITVLRDGRLVSTRPTTEVTRTSLIHEMVGRDLETLHGVSKSESITAGADSHTGLAAGRATGTAIELTGLTRIGVFEDISLSVRAGEIVGLSGLVGAGRSEIARAIFGIDPCDFGSISISGKTLNRWTTGDMINAGVAFVPEDRQHEGLVLQMSVADNILMTNYKHVTRTGFISARAAHQLVDDQVKRFQIRAASSGLMVEFLSGGNQQKVVLGKWLAGRPRVLILDEPTRGVDVGAKHQIHELIEQLAGEGLAVLLISSELPELLRLSHRLIVIREGRIAGEFASGNVSQEEILAISLPDAGRSAESRQ